jgi:hypothetical protein
MIRGKSPDKACQAIRADSVDDIARKCEELGLKPKTNRRRKPAPSPLIVRMGRRVARPAALADLIRTINSK